MVEVYLVLENLSDYHHKEFQNCDEDAYREEELEFSDAVECDGPAGGKEDQQAADEVLGEIVCALGNETEDIACVAGALGYFEVQNLKNHARDL